MTPLAWKPGDRAELQLGGSVVVVRVREVREHTLIVATSSGLELETPRARVWMPPPPMEGA